MAVMPPGIENFLLARPRRASGPCCFNGLSARNAFALAGRFADARSREEFQAQPSGDRGAIWMATAPVAQWYVEMLCGGGVPVILLFF